MNDAGLAAAIFARDSRPCAAEGCGRRFVPRDGRHRYCSPACTDRDWHARAYARDPEKFRARSRAYKARRRAETT